MTREGERELVKVEHVNGGDGYIVREAMVTSEEVGEACKMYAKIHLDPYYKQRIKLFCFTKILRF